MSLIGSQFGNLPGMGAVQETFEQAVTFGPYPARYWKGTQIAPTAVDVGNNPSSTLRMGLVLGRITATGQWTNYVATNTDGSQVAQGVLALMLRLQDVFSEQNVAKYFGVMVSGGVQASKLLGLDNQARVQMSKQFLFDDNLAGLVEFPWLQFQSKTANYQILSTDNLTHFDNLGATGAVTFTLPPIQNGYAFGFHAIANFNLLVTSFEGGNIVGFNNATASTISLQTGGQIIGGGLTFFTNAAGTKWLVENDSAGANTITTM